MYYSMIILTYSDVFLFKAWRNLPTKYAVIMDELASIRVSTCFTLTAFLNDELLVNMILLYMYIFRTSSSV